MRLAVLSDHSDQKLCRLIVQGLEASGLSASVFRSEQEEVGLEIMDPASPCHAFAPDVVYLNLSTQAVRDRYYAAPDECRGEVAETLLKDLRGWVETLLAQHVTVVMNVLPMPLERHGGHFSACLADSLPRQIAAINQAVMTDFGRRDGVLVHDVGYLASSVGLSRWYDERFWCHAKYVCHPSWLPRYADSVLAILRVWRGREVIKCFVTDLDNTLWHGVIGDDGLEGIEVGGLGVGEAHRRFQQYLRTLKQRGFLLAVCSKNDEATARLPFQQHSGMVLKEADFACFVANWRPKSDNLRAIAAELNLGLESLVFLDDSAFEREEVRSALPQVRVPELPEDPADFAMVLEGLPGLEMTARPSSEDVQRTAFYHSERERVQSEQRASSRESFLTSLAMRGAWQSMGLAELSRAAQLIQRSNQFNLRTQRLSTEQLRAYSERRDGFACVCSLEDRFGSHGIIAVLAGAQEGSSLVIHEWVMSCRVLGRGVEEFILHRLLDLAEQRACDHLVGEYLPTAKNGLVAGLYERLGFQRREGETTCFELRVDTADRLNTYVANAQDCPSL